MRVKNPRSAAALDASARERAVPLGTAPVFRCATALRRRLVRPRRLRVGGDLPLWLWSGAAAGLRRQGGRRVSAPSRGSADAVAAPAASIAAISAAGRGGLTQ